MFLKGEIMKLNKEELEKLRKAVKHYNNSSWMDVFEEEYILKDVIASAEEIGVDEKIKKMDDYDKYLYHKEEGMCGMI